MGSEQGASCPRVWEGLQPADWGGFQWLLLTHFKIQDLSPPLSSPYNHSGPLLTTSG